jgi:hypothetical protein
MSEVEAPARTWRSRFRLIHLAPILALIALSAWIFASPIGSSPDDDFHLTSTWCANGLRTDLCEAGPTEKERVVPPVLLHANCYAYHPESSAECQDEYLALDTDPSVVTERGSFEQNYPPVYYFFMNTFASHDLQVSALVMRFVNVLLFLGIVTALYCLLPRERRAGLIWTWILTVVPLGMFLVASNNPSAWAIIGVGSSWLALVGFVETTGRRRIALGAIFALTVIMAAGARGDGAIYSIIGMAVAGVLTFRRERRWLLSAILPVALAVLCVVLYFSSRQATVAVSGLHSPGAAEVPLDAFGRLAYNVLNVPSLWAGIFGSWGLGWLDTDLPTIVWLAGLGVFVAVGFLGLRTRSWRKIAAIGGLVLVLWAVPVYVLYAGGNVVGENLQPRYLLPLIIMLAGVLVFSIRGRTPRLGRVQQVVVVLALAMAQALALHFNLRRYLTGIDEQGWNLDSGAEWWWSGLPVSPMGLWFIGSAAFTALLFVLVRQLGRRHELSQ